MTAVEFEAPVAGRAVHREAMGAEPAVPRLDVLPAGARPVRMTQAVQQLGIGADAWDRLFTGPRPRQLHPYRALDGAVHHAASTPGDLLFHLRAESLDLCFELAGQILDALGPAVTVVDEVHGFTYFDERDLRMPTNMFLGDPPGNYDRILDFSTAVTGGLFFVPTGDFLDDVSDDLAAPQATPRLIPSVAIRH